MSTPAWVTVLGPRPAVTVTVFLRLPLPPIATGTGLGLVDGKKENANETTHVGKVFPMDKQVEIEITVTKRSIKLVADDKTIFEWVGDASKLSMPKVWAVPNKKWLALGCYMAEFETSKLILEKSK